MSKILISCATLGSGGAERVISILSKPFADKFEEVVVVMWVKAPVFYPVDHRVRLVCLPDYCGISDRQLEMFYFRRIVKQEKPDLILSFLQPFNLRVLISTLGLRVKTVVAERNDPSIDKILIQWLEKIFYRLADGIVVQTKTIENFYTGKLGSKVVVIYNPVKVDESNVGNALSINKEKRIVSVARLMPQKHHENTIKTYSRFLKSHPDYKLEIYGEGPERNNLEKIINELGLQNNVFLPGTSKSILNDIQSAKMFVQVSSHEGMSNSMIEAMCLGLPCICTKVSGAVDLIVDGENGFLIDIGDENSLLEKMTEIADDDMKAKFIGENASQIYQKLQTDFISKQWISYIKKIINK